MYFGPLLPLLGSAQQAQLHILYMVPLTLLYLASVSALASFPI